MLAADLWIVASSDAISHACRISAASGSESEDVRGPGGVRCPDVPAETARRVDIPFIAAGNHRDIAFSLPSSFSSQCSMVISAWARV